MLFPTFTFLPKQYNSKADCGRRRESLMKVSLLGSALRMLSFCMVSLISLFLHLCSHLSTTGTAKNLLLGPCNTLCIWMIKKRRWPPLWRKETAWAGKGSLRGPCQHPGTCFMLLCFSVPWEELAENRQIPQVWLDALAPSSNHVSCLVLWQACLF